MISSPVQLRRFEPKPDEWERWNETQAQVFKPRIVPEELREEYARTTSLRAFYWDCRDQKDAVRGIVPSRWHAIGRRKGRSQHTIDKELNALTRWERFSVPADWPADQAWPACPQRVRS